MVVLGELDIGRRRLWGRRGRELCLRNMRRAVSGGWIDCLRRNADCGSEARYGLILGRGVRR